MLNKSICRHKAYAKTRHAKRATEMQGFFAAAELCTAHVSWSQCAKRHWRQENGLTCSTLYSPLVWMLFCLNRYWTWDDLGTSEICACRLPLWQKPKKLHLSNHKVVLSLQLMPDSTMACSCWDHPVWLHLQ